MKVIKITPALFDVFLFDGWENWSRWERSKTGYIKQVGGKELPKFIKHNIISKLMEMK